MDSGSDGAGWPVAVWMSVNRSRACWGWARIPTAAARRTSTGRVSPRAPRPVARPPIEALNRNASGASARMKISPVPGSEVWSLSHTPKDPCAAASASAAASGSHSSQQASMMASIRPHDNAWAYFAILRSTTATVSTLRCRVASAVRRPIHGFTSPAQTLAHSLGRRWRRSSASPTSRSAADDEVARTTPSSAGANSATPGVPSPPKQTSFSDPGSSGLVARASSLCRSAQCAAAFRMPTSARSATARAVSTYDRVAVSSRAIEVSVEHVFDFS